MKTRNMLGTVAALLLVTGCTQVAIAMAGEFGKNDSAHPLVNSSWPANVAVMVNRPDRISGHWINALDTFFYAGDAKAFNDFLQQYAKVPGTHILLLAGKSKNDPVTDFVLQPDGGLAADWQLQAGVGMANVMLPLNGRIALHDLRVPNNIDIDYVGERTKEVKAFLGRHPRQHRKR